ncbi:MAG: MFS transporter [Pseudomonadota bacterium]
MLDWIGEIKPRLNALFRPGGTVFYGWWIVAACAGVQWLGAMTWMHSYGAYAVMMKDEFGWSMTVLSAAFALTRLESGLLGPFQGWLVDRYGPRRILTIGTLIFGLGFFAFAYVDSITTYFVAFILIALGSSLGGFATLMVSLVHWFDRHRAKAVAWSQIGFSLGGLSVPLVIIGLESWGWRTMAVISGCAVLLIAGPLVQLVRHRPEEIGEVADGIRETDATVDGAAATPQTSHTWRQAVREPSFWLISAGHGLSLFTVSAMLAHLIPHLTFGQGYTTVQAGIVFSFMTGTQLLGLFVGGYLGDRFNKRLLCVACMIGHVMGLLALTYMNSLLGIALFVLCHGLGWGVRGPLMVALRAEYFGTASFGTIMGISSLIVMIGMTGGPLIGGIMFDVYGNYTSAFTIIAGLSLTGSFCFWAARPPKTRPVQPPGSPAAT